MIYTIGRLLDDLRTIGGEFNSDYSFSKAKMTVEEALSVFLSPRWPFNEGEAGIATVGPYSTGTVAVVNGSATVTLTGGTWLTSWVTPAIIRIDGSVGEPIVVQSFDSASTLTLDMAWPFDSLPTATYSIEFPSHVIPSYISVMGVTECRLSVNRPLAQTGFGELLAKRSWVPHTYWPSEYSIIPADGVNSQKLYIWPPPAQVQTFRYRYCKAVPAFRYYRDGTADCAAPTTAVTGTGTKWLKLGYSLVGQYFEFIDQPGHQNVIQSVTTDTALVLTSNYLGVAAVGTPYCISPSIICPDDLKPLLRAICRWKYLEDAAPALAPEAEKRYLQLRDQAISRSDIQRDASPMLPIMYGEYDWGGPPPTPTILRVE